jgi:Fe-S cluster biosynthesis and repair protein YggX
MPGVMTDSPTRRTVRCVKLGRDLPGLDAPPWPGPLGQRIFEHVSQDAWDEWEERMKMILNEYRLLPFQKEAQVLVAKQMDEYFFGVGGATPPDYVPEKETK